MSHFRQAHALPVALGKGPPDGGTGSRLSQVIIILAGVAALAATLLTIVSIWLQSKNYRKPLLQRYVIRILVLVPIYSAASWTSLVSLKAAFWIDPFRDVYEAFTLYAFFQLLINFIGGERSLIIMMHGRPPVSHPWPLNRCFAKIDISDPHTFLTIKRGILQYTWIKPVLSLAIIIMKATGTYQEGYIGLGSGYLWLGIIYNLSITISLYALAMFWVCMSVDLKPFRPMPKFLCIKGIIFASYWQGFFLSILVWLGAFPDTIPGYTPDNLAAALQDALICFEMPLFAIAHWYAFSWHDYADVTISAARMPVKFALRDAFGPQDLIQDAKETYAGNKYEYRYFDAEDDVLAHEDSGQRVARMLEGQRFERGGKGKYWIPKPGQIDSKTPLLKKIVGDDRHPIGPPGNIDDNEENYGTASDELTGEPGLDFEDEGFYANARALEFGDWNYPVITAHQATREDVLYRNPDVLTASTNRNLLQPTRVNRKMRKNRIEEIRQTMNKGKHREGSTSTSEPPANAHTSFFSSLTRQRSPSEESSKSDRSQLVDLVVEDVQAEEIERVRARKEGSPEWNRTEPKHFVRAYPDHENESEMVREGFESTDRVEKISGSQHNSHDAFAVGEGDNADRDEAGGNRLWKKRDYTHDDEEVNSSQR